MNYLSIETYFNENKLNELLDIYKEDLETAEEYANLFTNNSIASPIECQEALDVLTGLYMKFNSVFHIADYQYTKRKQINKISVGETDTCYSLDCLRIRNIFKAYTDNVKKAILSCQSQLKFYIHEMNLTK
jgi:hypothetical protein